jgi:hypothetical protein
MTQEDVNVVKGKMNQLGLSKVVFYDDDGKIDPIICDGLNIVGLFISDSGILWLVDDTEIMHDIHKDIRPWYFHDKHLALKFNIEQALLDKLSNVNTNNDW